MPRKSKKPKRGKSKTAEKIASKSRRNTLTLIRNAAIGVAVLGGAGVFSVRAVRATIAEQDLTRLGNGIPTIVQIHDPTCALCTELQRNARRALRHFDKTEVNYLVANIQTAEGSAFAGRYGAQHVTLLLFDGRGRLRDTLEGVRPREELEAHFQRLLAAS